MKLTGQPTRASAPSLPVPPPHLQALHLRRPPSRTLCAACPFIAALCASHHSSDGPLWKLLLTTPGPQNPSSGEAPAHPLLPCYYRHHNCFFMPLSLLLSGELRNSRNPSFCTPSRLHLDSLAPSRPSNLCLRDEPTSSAGKPKAPSQQWRTSRTIPMTCKLSTEFHFPVYRVQNLWTSMSSIHRELQTRVCSCYCSPVPSRTLLPFCNILTLVTTRA